MKKVLLMLVAAAFISTSMISCSDCGSCAALGNVEFCKSDDKTAYDAAKLTCGATWKASK